jgi:CheY-like chemotaxis protein
MSSLPSVFVAEDEILVLMALEEMLKELGYQVESASNIELALELAESCCCAIAILDLNLHGQTVDPVAAVLARRGIPFAIASGMDRTDIQPYLANGPLLPKPYLIDDVSSVVAKLLGTRVSCTPRTTERTRQCA